MNEREALYLAALLHDVGALLLRAGVASAHDPLRASRAFLAERAGKTPFPPAATFPPDWGGAADGSVPGAVRDALLRAADGCVRPASVPASSPGTRLESIFARVEMQRAGTLFRAGRPLPLSPVSLSIGAESQFPASSAAPPAGVWHVLADAFLTEAGQVLDAAGWFALAERHFVNVPLDADGRVGMFDAARVRAALALCLYDEWKAGSWNGRTADQIRTGAAALPAPFLLVVGGLSGIQDFIFDIPSRRASRSLKGRSSYVQLAADACARRLVDALDLRESSLLYNGGGSFVLLAPACGAARLIELREELGRALLPESLALALDWTSVSVADFEGARFGERWAAAHTRAQRRRYRRFQELGTAVFEPQPQRPRERDDAADPFAERTRELSLAAGLRWTRLVSDGGSADEGDLLRRLGYGLELLRDDAPIAAAANATVFNRTDFAGRFRDFRFAVKDLPRYTRALLERLPPLEEGDDDERQEGTIVQFADLSRMAGERTGTRKLGVLKMDVDDLGELFSRGLPQETRTVTSLVALSRSVKWFFEGHLNEIIGRGTFRWIGARPGEGGEEAFAPNLYPVFSGGDDFFVVGAWDAVFAFAFAVRESFRAFVGGHPGVTLSAALTVVDPKESVVRFAERADARLEEAKDADPGKDRVSVFDQVLRWSDFAQAAELRETLEILVKRKGESQNILQRVQQSAEGHARIQAAAVRGAFRPERIWRLAYFLGRTARPENRAEIERIADLHQRLLLDAYVRRADAANPALFAVAGRWAELACRQRGFKRADLEPSTR